MEIETRGRRDRDHRRGAAPPRGVVLADGEALRATAVVSNLNPKLLFEPGSPEPLARGFSCPHETLANGSGTFRMNVALSDCPPSPLCPAHGDHHSGIIIAPTLSYMDRAYHDAREFGWSRKPIVEILIPSTLDPSLAPKGAHVASLFCQHVAPELPDGASWDDHRDEVADLMIRTVDELCAGLCAQRHRPADQYRPSTSSAPSDLSAATSSTAP